MTKPLDLEWLYNVLETNKKNSELEIWCKNFNKKLKQEIKQCLKSALQGLMEEIRLTDLEWVVYSDGSQKRMSEKERKEIIIEFIKKWFPDVVKDD